MCIAWPALVTFLKKEDTSLSPWSRGAGTLSWRCDLYGLDKWCSRYNQGYERVSDLNDTVPGKQIRVSSAGRIWAWWKADVSGVRDMLLRFAVTSSG